MSKVLYNILIPVVVFFVVLCDVVQMLVAVFVLEVYLEMRYLYNEAESVVSIVVAEFGWK